MQNIVFARQGFHLQGLSIPVEWRDCSNCPYSSECVVSAGLGRDAAITLGGALEASKAVLSSAFVIY